MSAATHILEADEPHAHFNSSTEQMMMVILDNDLANVIQAERRRHSASERLHDELIRTAHNPAPRFSLWRLAAAWLRAQTTMLLRGFRAHRRRDPSSLESV